MMLIVSVSSFSQQTNPASTLTKQDYLQKSKNQKKVAWIMLGGGVAFVVGGFISGTSDLSSTSAGPAILIYTGGASILASIPVFMASAKNKRKAMNMSASFKMEKAPIIQNRSFVQTSFPAFSQRLTCKSI